MKYLLAGVFLILSFPGLALAASPKDAIRENGIKPDEARAVKPLVGRLFGGKILIGIVVSVANKTITAAQADGNNLDILVTEITKYSKGGRKINLNGLAVGDRIFVLGTTSTDGTFIARSIVAKSKILKELKKLPFIGVVDQVSTSAFTIKNKVKDDVVEIVVNNQTQIKRGSKKITLAGLLPGTRVVVIALNEDDGTLTGKMVVVLPTKPIVAPASPSPNQ